MIKVYTTPVCPWCHALMDWLDQQNIKYEEVDASTMSDITAVPVTEINGERIVGFDRPAIKEALAKTKAKADNKESQAPAESIDSEAAQALANSSDNNEEIAEAKND